MKALPSSQVTEKSCRVQVSGAGGPVPTAAHHQKTDPQGQPSEADPASTRKGGPQPCSPHPRSAGSVQTRGLSHPPLLAGGLLRSGPPAPRHQLQVVQAVVHSHGVQVHHLEAGSDAPAVPLPGDRQTAL